jgi:hypothetical protein
VWTGLDWWRSWPSGTVRSFVRSCDGRDVGHLRLCDWTRRAYAWSSPRGGTRSGSGTRWLIARDTHPPVFGPSRRFR